MRWITATDLSEWAKRLDARASFVELVSDLIRASISSYDYFRFPGGDKAQVRGFDGDLETTQAFPPYIPKGYSKWEFGVSPGIGKAEDDYEKRTRSTDSKIKSENTLVLVNLNTWDTPTKKITEWIAEKKESGGWKEVLYIDGAQLESWLDDHPAVAARYARHVLNLAPKEGVQCIDEFWQFYSSQFKPNLTEDVLLCDREQQVNTILESLSGGARSFRLGAQSPDDVVAFAVAAIRKAPSEIRLMLEARTLIVESEEAARFLNTKKGLSFIVKGVGAFAGMLGQHGPTLSEVIGVKAKSTDELIRPSASSLGQALVTMGFEHNEAYTLARNCGRSIRVLRRLIPNGPVGDPEWLSHAHVLLPAILAGGWSTNSSLDKEIIKHLSNFANYNDFEREIRKSMLLSDKPMDNIEDVWKVLSHVDSFPYFIPLIGDDEIQRLKETVTKVFGQVNTPPSPDEKFSLNYSPPDDYSSWIRDGIASSLLQFATCPESYGLFIKNYQSPQHFVDEIIKNLPIWGRGHQAIVSLSNQLSLIAEAAPIPFLVALESMLKGDQADILKIFSESRDYFSVSSPHVYVLWALEVLAWDPTLLTRVCIVLSKLASIDPGGKTSNRPINSLRTILLPWSPCTYATSKQRITCIDAILATTPSIGWELLVKLLPTAYGHTSPTPKPKLRDVAPEFIETLTFGIVEENNIHIVNRTIEASIDNETRLSVLIRFISRFGPQEKIKVLLLIDQHLANNLSNTGNPVWFALREEIQKHETFVDADWVMHSEELHLLTEVLEKYKPIDLIINSLWLFDDLLPLGNYRTDDSIPKIRSDRVEKIQKINNELGVKGILRLLDSAKNNFLVLESLADCKFDPQYYFGLLKECVGEKTLYRQYLSGISSIAFREFGDEWTSLITNYLHDNENPPDLQADLLLTMKNNSSTWKIVGLSGALVESIYWKKMKLFPNLENFSDLIFAIEKYQAFGRSIDVFSNMQLPYSSIPKNLILTLLDDAVIEINSNNDKYTSMTPFYIENVLKALKKRDDIDIKEIAAREIAYFHILTYTNYKFVLYEYMATSPNFYFSFIYKTFNGKNERPKEISKREQEIASMSFQIISSFKIIPGQNGDSISYEILINWINEVRNYSAANDRIEITDQYIGHVLANSPKDPTDGLWPHTSVRKVIDFLENEMIETGISIGLFNSRGVVVKSTVEGGEQERKLEESYRSWASGMDAYPRTRDMLLAIAEQRKADAKREDLFVEKNKLIH